MSIQQQVVLRFRTVGHVRFGLPAGLCRADVAARLLAGLHDTTGIYRVDLYPRQRKLSIRYAEVTIDFNHLAAVLATLIADIERTIEPGGSAGTDLAATRVPSVPGHAGTWARRKFQEIKEAAAALRIVFRNALGKGFPSSPEKRKFVSEFLTDVLVLYLIKTHWHLITQHWLKRPWQYRYEWMAALYMIFLLVSSKKPKH